MGAAGFFTVVRPLSIHLLLVDRVRRAKAGAWYADSQKSQSIRNHFCFHALVKFSCFPQEGVLQSYKGSYKVYFSAHVCFSFSFLASVCFLFFVFVTRD